MPRITFVSPDGARRDVEAPVGASVMRAAVTSGIDEILAECGGSLACGTCHVYVEASQLAALPPASAVEEEMLGFVASERGPNSRLSCQIVMSEALDGLVVHLPERQE